MNTPVRIGVTFDFVCPWCYFAKANLDKAIEELSRESPDARVSVAWRGTRLLPHIPLQGVPYQAFYEQRLGGPEMVKRRRAQVEEMASESGLSLRLEHIGTMPNTAKAHSLYRYAADHAAATVSDALLEDLFNAYFCRGMDIGNDAILLDVAETHGLNRADITAFLVTSPQPVDQDLIGSSVPYFEFAPNDSVAGAISTHALLGKFRRIPAQDIYGAAA